MNIFHGSYLTRCHGVPPALVSEAIATGAARTDGVSLWSTIDA